MYYAKVFDQVLQLNGIELFQVGHSITLDSWGNKGRKLFAQENAALNWCQLSIAIINELNKQMGCILFKLSDDSASIPKVIFVEFSRDRQTIQVFEDSFKWFQLNWNYSSFCWLLSD